MQKNHQLKNDISGIKVRGQTYLSIWFSNTAKTLYKNKLIICKRQGQFMTKKSLNVPKKIYDKHLSNFTFHASAPFCFFSFLHVFFSFSALRSTPVCLLLTIC